VPVWRIALSRPLPIVGLVSRYLTNYLMGRTSISKRRSFDAEAMPLPHVMEH
jgi:hypothetical protein